MKTLKSFLLFKIVIFLIFSFGHAEKSKFILDDSKTNLKTEIFLASETRTELTIQFNVNEFYFENIQTEKGLFSKLSFENVKGTIKIGKPQLPVFRKIMELPYDANPIVEVIISESV